jgi:hypothetical protein
MILFSYVYILAYCWWTDVLHNLDNGPWCPLFWIRSMVVESTIVLALTIKTVPAFCLCFNVICVITDVFFMGQLPRHIVALLRCSSLFKVDCPGRYVRHRRRIQDDAFLGTDQAPPSSPLMVRRQGEFSWSCWSSEATGMVRDVPLMFNLG